MLGVVFTVWLKNCAGFAFDDFPNSSASMSMDQTAGIAEDSSRTRRDRTIGNRAHELGGGASVTAQFADPGLWRYCRRTSR